MKIAILGYSGSGKSTLAHYISEQKDLRCLHLDKVHFKRDWVERPDKEAKEMVMEFMENPDWVIDGNYTGFYQSERLEQADRIIILLFSRWAALRRVLTRYVKYRGKTRPDMGDGCNEKVDREFVWWVLYQGRSKSYRNKYRNIQIKYPEKTIVIRNQKELDKLYTSMSRKSI